MAFLGSLGPKRSPVLPVSALAILAIFAVEGYTWAWLAVGCALLTAFVLRAWSWGIALLISGFVVGGLHWDQLSEQSRSLELAQTSPWIDQQLVEITEVRGMTASGLMELDGQRLKVELRQWTQMNWEAGDRALVSGRLLPLPESRNPKRFRVGEWLWRRAISGQLKVVDFEKQEGVAWHGIPRRYGQRVANRLEHNLTRGLSSDDPGRAVILGVVLGKQGELSDLQMENFRRSGALHVFAVSGMHVGIVALLGWAILRWSGIDRHRLAWLLIILMFAYAWVTGFRPSALRAAVMGSVLLSGVALRRKSGGMNRLALASLILLVFDGHQLFTAGFQLSFVVMAAILLIGPKLETLVPAKMPIDPWLPRPLWSDAQVTWHAIVLSLRGMIVVTVAAWLGSVWLSVVHFQLISPAGLLASIPMVAGAFTVLSLGAASLLLGWAFPSVIALNAKVAAAMAGFAMWLGGQSWAAFDLRDSLPGNECWVLNVEEGSAAFFGGEFATLLDAGDRSAGQYEVLPALEVYQTTPGTLILSHGDEDHVGGALPILAAQPDWSFALPLGESRSPALRQLTQDLLAQGRSSWLPRAGDRIRVGEGYLNCLASGSLKLGLDRGDDRCSVWRWECRGWRVLFMGDSGIDREQQLTGSSIDLRSDILVLGKHGRDLSGTIDFILAVQPKLIIATDENFPAEERRSPAWIAKIRELGIPLFLQSDTGAIHLKLEDQSLRAKGLLNGEVNIGR